MARQMNFTSRGMCKHHLWPAFQQPHPEESPPDVIKASSHPAFMSSSNLPLRQLPEVICHVHSLSCATLGCCYALLAYWSSMPFLHLTGASWTQFYTQHPYPRRLYGLWSHAESLQVNPRPQWFEGLPLSTQLHAQHPTVPTGPTASHLHPQAYLRT